MEWRGRVRETARRIIVSDAALAVTMFAAAMLRFVYAGLEYYPQLDDYIQYHNYTLASDMGKLLDELGAFAVRPLALVSDIFVWSRFWECMIVPLIIMTALYTASAFLFRGTFRRIFPFDSQRFGNVFVLVYILLPIGIEGTYWLSASSRIVPAMFFASLSAYALVRFADGGGRWLAVVFAAANLLSVGYYEQCLAISVTLTVITSAMLMLRGGKTVRRRAWMGAFALVSVAAYVIVTKVIATPGGYSERVEMALPNNPYYFKVFLPELLRQIGEVFTVGTFYTFVKGAYRGILMIITDRAFVFAAAALIVADIAAHLAVRGRDSAEHADETDGSTRAFADKLRRSRVGLPVICGILLAAAPISVYFVVANPWFSLRAVTPALCGIALAADALTAAAGRALRRMFADGRGVNFAARGIKIAASYLFVLLCICAGASETADYRDTYIADCAAVEAVAETAVRDDWREVNVGVLAMEVTTLPNQNFFWHEHIHGVTESSWALSGAITAMAPQAQKNERGFEVVPLPQEAGIFWRAWNRDAKQLEIYDLLYCYDGQTLRRVEFEPNGQGGGTVTFTDDGSVCAEIRCEGEYGYIEYK